MIGYFSKTLRLAVWLCLLEHSFGAEPTPFKCECPDYEEINVKQEQTCCTAMNSDIVDAQTTKSCGMRDPYVDRILGSDKKNEADYGSYIKLILI